MFKKLAALVLLFMTVNIYAAKIVCTTYPVWLLTRMLTQGTDASTELLTPPAGGCAHGYTPLPGDLIKIKSPDTILIANGNGVDDHLVSSAVRANKHLRLIKCDIPAADAHTFASADTAAKMLIKIAADLQKYDPANGSTYQQNLQKILPEFNKLIRRTATLPYKNKYLILHHKLFVNMANLCGAKIILLKHEQSASLRAADLIQLVQTARRSRVKTIWAENHHHDPAVKLLVRESRCRIIELDMLTGGSLQVPVDHYITVMQLNLQKLEETNQ